MEQKLQAAYLPVLPHNHCVEKQGEILAHKIINLIKPLLEMIWLIFHALVITNQSVIDFFVENFQSKTIEMCQYIN